VAWAWAIGLVFGFALQRGGFCGSAMLSTVVLYRDTRGLVAILLSISTAMCGFALLARLDWVIPNPNPMRLLSAVVGGALFGVGMVLAGGCVTGSLFKAGEGRLTSILAVLGIGLGSNLASRGLLAPVKRSLVRATRSVHPPAGLYQAAGAGYSGASLTAGLAGVALAAALLWRQRRRGPQTRSTAGGADARRLLRSPWSVATAGLVIGVLEWVAYAAFSDLGRNYPLGGLRGVMVGFSVLVGGHWTEAEWSMAQTGGTLLGAALSARLCGNLALRAADPATLLVALGGGVLVGAGAVVGHGCFIGNTVSGLALLSLHSAVFTVTMVLANWATTVLYLRGLR
jgi:hypothetical protein